MKRFVHYMEARSNGLNLLHRQELSTEQAQEHDSLQLNMIYEISDGKELSKFLVWNIETINKPDMHEKHVVLIKVNEGMLSHQYH